MSYKAHPDTIRVFERAPVKIGLLVSVLAAFAIAGCFMIASPASFDNSFKTQITGWLAVLLFGGLTLVGSKKLLRLPRQVYILSDTGITLANISPDEISWDAIASVTKQNAQLASFTVLTFTPEFIAARKGWLNRKAVSLGSVVVKADAASIFNAVYDAHAVYQARQVR